MNSHEKKSFTLRAWYRVVFGVILAVFISSIIVSSTTRENNIQGCLRATLDRIDTARKDSRDSIRERVLALSYGLAPSVKYQHVASAQEAARAAASYMTRAGLSSYDSPDAIVHIDPNAPEIKADRVSFCEKANAAPFPLNLVQ